MGDFDVPLPKMGGFLKTKFLVLMVALGLFLLAGSCLKSLKVDFYQDSVAVKKAVGSEKFQSISKNLEQSQIKKENPEIFNQNNSDQSVFLANLEPSEFEKKLYGIVGDYPIKEMVPFIAEEDERVAAFIVGIAKKESNWGKHVPTQNGQDCYNYWGYKGAGQKGTAMGYGCFATPEEAVSAIGGRLSQLVEKDLTTPSKMVVWKCGSSCAGHNPEGVNKWISDVSVYFNQIVS